MPLIKAALRYRGFAFIDVISPCVTFNNPAVRPRATIMCASTMRR